MGFYNTQSNIIPFTIFMKCRNTFWGYFLSILSILYKHSYTLYNLVTSHKFRFYLEQGKKRYCWARVRYSLGVDRRQSILCLWKEWGAGRSFPGEFPDTPVLSATCDPPPDSIQHLSITRLPALSYTCPERTKVTGIPGKSFSRGSPVTLRVCVS